jgi:hypothetical protein
MDKIISQLLDNEILPMEAASLVTVSLFSSTEGTLQVVMINLLENWNRLRTNIHGKSKTYKVLGRFGNDIGTELKGDSTNIFTTDFHVKIDCNEEVEKE